jgi:hypothetical protein
MKNLKLELLLKKVEKLSKETSELSNPFVVETVNDNYSRSLRGGRVAQNNVCFEGTNATCNNFSCLSTTNGTCTNASCY